jgi:hypothetical protein
MPVGRGSFQTGGDDMSRQLRPKQDYVDVYQDRAEPLFRRSNSALMAGKRCQMIEK